MKLRRTIGKYAVFVRSGMQMLIAYRGFALLWLVGTIITAVIMGLLWWAVYGFSADNVIGGMTYAQMLLYVILSAVVRECSYSDTMGAITDDVRFGNIGMRLIKPINYRMQLGCTSFGSFFMRMLIMGLPVVAISTVICVFGFGLNGLTWYGILLFLPACVLSSLVYDAIGFIFGQLAFRTQAMFGVSSMSEIVVSFLSGGMVPLSLFPVWAQTVLFYTPFPTAVGMPVKLFLGLMSPMEILVSFAVSIGWIILLNVLAHFLYKGSVRHLVVFGG